VNLCLAADEAAALTKLVQRLGPEDCTGLAGPSTSYGDRPENEVMWNAFRPCPDEKR
jgi:hypothetical protein